ncbi:MAG: hypothetical protein BGN88_02720 [Clostridiales bacterium 43-6]|nr:MAG: hypothetical protein BGN88_02720 [Clostridiales bacterium 43-6]
MLCVYLGASAVYMISASEDSVFAGGLKAVLLSCFCVMLFDYYMSSGKMKELKLFCLFSLLFYLMGSTVSMLLFGGQVEEIKRAVSEGGQNAALGNFGTFYSAVFVLGGSLFLLFSAKGKIRFLGLFGVIISVFLLFYGQFTLSIMLSVFLLILLTVNVLCKPKPVVWIALFAITAIVFLLLLQDISQLLLSLSNIVPQGYISERLSDMASFIREDNSFHSAARIDLYYGDFMNFLNYPLTGTLAPKAVGMNVTLLAGGHSSMLGLFANYGIVVAVCFLLFFFYPYKKIWKLWEGHAYRRYLTPMLFIFLLLSFVNPTFNVQTLCFVMMMIIPSLPLLTMKADDMPRCLSKF